MSRARIIPRRRLHTLRAGLVVALSLTGALAEAGPPAPPLRGEASLPVAPDTPPTPPPRPKSVEAFTDPAMPDFAVPDPKPMSPSRLRSVIQSPSKPTDGKKTSAEPDAPLPGRFAPEPTKLPSPFLRDKVVAPHTPDVHVDLSDRTSVGAFGDVSQNPLKAENRITPTPARPLQGLDMGAGVTLQYKFPTN